MFKTHQDWGVVPSETKIYLLLFLVLSSNHVSVVKPYNFKLKLENSEADKDNSMFSATVAVSPVWRIKIKYNQHCCRPSLKNAKRKAKGNLALMFEVEIKGFN